MQKMTIWSFMDIPGSITIDALTRFNLIFGAMDASSIAGPEAVKPDILGADDDKRDCSVDSGQPSSSHLG